MINRRIRERLLALILTACMMLPAAVFGTDEITETPAAESVTAAAETGAELEDAAASPADTESADEGAEQSTQESAETAETETEAEASAPDSSAEEAAEEPAQTEPALLAGLSAEEDPTGTVELTWEAFEGAAYYEASSPQINSGEPLTSTECAQSFSGLEHGAAYDFAVAAYDENGSVIAQSAVSIETVAYKIKFNESYWRVLGNRTVKPKKLSGNLTKMIKEPNSGYAVVQGGCTDGKYAYYLMVSSYTQKGRVLKVRIKGNKVVKRSKVLNTWHGNGMAYDSKRKKLVVIAREHRKQQLTVIDAKTLKITKQKNVKYNYDINAGSNKLNKRYKESGLAAIAYVKKYDCYIALERVYHNLLIFDPDSFECIGLAYTDFDSKYPGKLQAMDADSKYVYLLLSYYSKRQPYNLILAIDWNSENMLPVVNASKSKDLPYVPDYWYCGNGLDGKADAVVRIKTKREAENIYHTTGKDGKEHFYMAEYYGHFMYKKVGKKIKRYYKRDNYVYDLGII